MRDWTEEVWEGVVSGDGLEEAGGAEGVGGTKYGLEHESPSGLSQSSLRLSQLENVDTAVAELFSVSAGDSSAVERSHAVRLPPTRID